ncbi:MAG: type II secretion system secretin GspD [Alphaproteobacteria bacterium]|nr:type II secretion system secretin GspD [Alphaproteobacteria bacterium]
MIGPGVSRVRVAAGPRPPATELPTGTESGPSLPLPQSRSGESLSLDQVPLPTFINEVFSKTLKLNVQIDPTVMSRNDLVTLRTAGPLSGQELFAMAQGVLADYGIAASWDGKVLHVVTDQQLMAAMPEVIRGRAVPQLPTALRPIFQVVDLHQVSASDMMQWLTNAYGQNVRVIASPSTSSIMLFGLPQNVQAAVEAVQVLDQARLAGRGSLRVSPVYWTARDLAAKLVQLLKAEGYDASAAESTPAAAPGGTITVVPVETNNSLIVFAADPKILAHARRWIDDLDRPGLVDPTRDIFVYFVQNTTAASIGGTVQAVLAGGRAAVSAPAEAQLEQAGLTQSLAGPGQPGLGQSTPGGGAQGAGTPGLPPAQLPPPAPTPQAAVEPLTTNPAPQPGGGARAPAGPRVVVDAPRNALIIIGSAQDYQRVRPLLEALDKAPREALIEVTVAEVDLNDANNLGVEWTVVTPFGATRTQAFGTGGNVLTPPLPNGTGGGSVNGTGLSPLGTSGFNYTILNNLGDVYVVLNAFAQNNGLSVLSTPRVLAESGQAANIEVGTQVPIITGQTTTNVAQNGGTSGILQSIQYTQTGVLLSVRPVIHSGNRIDLTISQEVSQALPNNTVGITSPLIQNRNVSTQLSLADGQTVVIGGMIAENRTDNEGGIPYLKDIPGLGILFRSQMLSKTRTELLVFITPYVISNDSDAAAITRQFQEQMSKWTIPRTQLHW